MPQNQPVTTAVDLIPGQIYRVTAPFTDYDGISHPVGESWRFISKSFVPYHDGLALTLEQDGQQRVIRLLWQPGAQAEIIENFGRYVTASDQARQASASTRQPSPRGASRGSCLAIFGISLAVVVGFIVLAAVGFLAYFLNALAYRPSTLDVDITGITVELDAPISVIVGQDIILAVTVSNSNDQSVLLDSLVLDAKTMGGATLKSSDPAYLQVASFQHDGDYLRYDFQQPIPASSRLVIQFTLTGQNPGTYPGQVWVCTKNAENCTVHPWTLIVK